MGLTIKRKYAVYLRDEVDKIIQSYKVDKRSSHGSVINRLIKDYARLVKYFGKVLEQAEDYRNREKIGDKRGELRKIQVYIDYDQADFLEDFATSHTRGNISHAINLMVANYHAVGLTSPDTLAMVKRLK